MISKESTIEKYTEYLLGCNFMDDSFDPEDHEDHLEVSWELINTYSWTDIYPVWRQYLHEKCATPEDVINFVNLYIYYDAADKPVDDPVERWTWIDTGMRLATCLTGSQSVSCPQLGL